MMVDGGEAADGGRSDSGGGHSDVALGGDHALQVEVLVHRHGEVTIVEGRLVFEVRDGLHLFFVVEGEYSMMSSSPLLGQVP